MIFHSLLIVDQKMKDLQNTGICQKMVSAQKGKNSLQLAVDKPVPIGKRQMQNSLRFHMSSRAVKHTSNSLEKTSFHQREQSQLAKKHLMSVEFVTSWKKEMLQKTFVPDMVLLVETTHATRNPNTENSSLNTKKIVQNVALVAVEM